MMSSTIVLPLIGRNSQQLSIFQFRDSLSSRLFYLFLFVSRRAHFDLFDIGKKSNNVKLHFLRMFNIGNWEELMPEYLGFVTSIVDSEDLPLDISREVLQPGKTLKVIRKNLVKNLVKLFFEIAQNKEGYDKYYGAFSNNFMIGSGTHEDSQNSEKIVLLISFYPSKSGDEMTTLKDYVMGLKKGQNEIYYITNKSKKAKNSPFLEELKQKGYEALYMVDAIGEYVFYKLKDYEGKKLFFATKDEIEDKKKWKEEQKEKFEVLWKVIKNFACDKLEKVIISYCVVDSPYCLVIGKYGWTTNTERIMIVQILRYSSFAGHMLSKRAMEIKSFNKWKDMVDDFVVVPVLVEFGQLTEAFLYKGIVCRKLKDERPKDAYDVADERLKNGLTQLEILVAGICCCCIMMHSALHVSLIKCTIEVHHNLTFGQLIVDQDITLAVSPINVDSFHITNRKRGHIQQVSVKMVNWKFAATTWEIEFLLGKKSTKIDPWGQGSSIGGGNVTTQGDEKEIKYGSWELKVREERKRCIGPS